MNATLDFAPRMSTILAAQLEGAEARLLDRAQPDSYRSFEKLLQQMRAPQPQEEARAASGAALQLCQHLYANARSFDALPFARANLILAEKSGDAALVRRSHTACGLLLADTADIAGAIEHHVEALRLASRSDDAVEMSRVWNNIGTAFLVSGNFVFAAACFRRALSILHFESAQIYSRFTAFGNLAHCLFHTDELYSGEHFAGLAIREMTVAMVEQDPYNAVLLHRNYARLLVGLGKLDEAKIQVETSLSLAVQAGTPRASIAAAMAQSAYDIANGDIDLGLTRLDRALVLSRSIPATLRDTLVCVIRAQEKAGLPAQALIRLQELSDHVCHMAIFQIRRHLELADILGNGEVASTQTLQQTESRLTLRLPKPAIPAEWTTLQRLAVGAALRMETTGWHGIRVGVLTQALAMEYGLLPIQAMEYGQAAQLHDIGMASVPEGVLLHSAALNAVECALVRKHTEAGVAMLSGDQHPRMVIASDISKYHHANWDGHGYPSNVAENSIPLAARMCAVADVYDTLVTDHPYRKAWSMERAFVELRRVAGTQLDPDLVRCFEAVIRRESANEGIAPSIDAGLGNFQQLISALTEDRGFL